MRKGILKIWYISNVLYKYHVPCLPTIIYILIRIVCSATIPYSAEIGKNTVFPHGGQGVVIHKNVVICNNCKILPNVIIGGGT